MCNKEVHLLVIRISVFQIIVHHQEVISVHGAYVILPCICTVSSRYHIYNMILHLYSTYYKWYMPVYHIQAKMRNNL